MKQSEILSLYMKETPNIIRRNHQDILENIDRYISVEGTISFGMDFRGLNKVWVVCQMLKHLKEIRKIFVGNLAGFKVLIFAISASAPQDAIVMIRIITCLVRNPLPKPSFSYWYPGLGGRSNIFGPTMWWCWSHDSNITSCPLMSTCRHWRKTATSSRLRHPYKSGWKFMRFQQPGWPLWGGGNVNSSHFASTCGSWSSTPSTHDPTRSSGDPSWWCTKFAQNHQISCPSAVHKPR